jgi:hypothetical protein
MVLDPALMSVSGTGVAMRCSACGATVPVRRSDPNVAPPTATWTMESYTPNQPAEAPRKPGLFKGKLKRR